MAMSDRTKGNIEKANLLQLEKAYAILCEAEVDLQEKLKDILDAKARIMVQIDLRLNTKK